MTQSNGVKADSGMKFDQGQDLKQIMALVSRLSNRELGQLITALQKEENHRLGGPSDSEIARLTSNG